MPGSFALVEGMSVEAYLEMAGGASEYADEDAIFVVRANGAVEGVGRSGFLSFGRRRVSLEPGDRIVVPLKYDYIRGFDLTRDIVQIVYQSGIGLAAVVGLFRN
jgi:protein involved in polysaccharide export with SLBB domain